MFYAFMFAQEIERLADSYQSTGEKVARVIIFILAAFGVVASIFGRGGTITKILGAVLCGAIALASIGLLPGVGDLIEKDTKARLGSLPAADTPAPSLTPDEWRRLVAIGVSESR